MRLVGIRPSTGELIAIQDGPRTWSLSPDILPNERAHIADRTGYPDPARITECAPYVVSWEYVDDLLAESLRPSLVRAVQDEGEVTV